MTATYEPAHNEAVHGHAYAAKRPGEDTHPFASARPYVQQPTEVVPVHHAPSCGSCGETFAGDRAAFYVTPLLAGAEDAAVMSAGWREDDGTWTCTVCQSKANAPAPEPAPALMAREPAPDTDPYDQYHETSDELDARLTDWWDGNNQRNTAAHRKINARLYDAKVRLDEARRAAAA